MLIDTETVETSAIEFLEDGYHKLVITKCEFVTDENEGFKVEWQEETGKRKCFSNLYYSVSGDPTWAKFSRDSLRDLLWVFKIKGLETAEQAQKLSQWLISKTCIVKTKQRVYESNGERKTTVNTVSFYNEDGLNRSGMKAKLLDAPQAPKGDVPW